MLPSRQLLALQQLLPPLAVALANSNPNWESLGPSLKVFLQF